MIYSIDLQELGNLYSQLGGTWTGCGDAVDLATLAKCAAVKACRYGYPFSAVGNCWLFFSVLLCTVFAKPRYGPFFFFLLLLSL